MHVDIEDSDDALIIRHFHDSSRFIDTCLSHGGSVVVVCAQGVSRSVTLVLAYMLQYKNIGDPVACLEHLKRVYPSASPNDGFMQQLYVWYDMKFSYDLTNQTYRSLCARESAACAMHQGGEFDVEKLRDPRSEICQGRVIYRCRVCRTTLATSDNIMVDISVGGTSGFSQRRRAKDAQKSPMHSDSNQKASEISPGGIFVEPLRWMAGITENTQGKIYCPTCVTRLGSYNWAGMQNDDAQWITPAFQLHNSKLDVISRDKKDHFSSAGAIGIRQPKFSRASRPAFDPRRRTEHRMNYVIFDCDGVLVDSERASCEALRRAILEVCISMQCTSHCHLMDIVTTVQVTGFDIPHSFPRDFIPVFGMDVRACLEYYMEAFSLTEEFKSRHDALNHNDPRDGDWIAELATRTAAAKGSHYESITSKGIDPIQGAEQLMKDSCQTCVDPITKQTLVAIASSGSHAKIKHNLSSAKLWGIIPREKIVSAEEVAKGKPHPDVYLKALERLECTTPAQSAIVIEDSVHGIHAAFRARVGKIVAMTTSLNHKEMKEALVSLRQRETNDDQQNLLTDTESRIHLSPTCAVTIIGSTLPETYDALIEVLQ